MPFQSKSQLRLCFATQLKHMATGKKSSWDCDQWLRETKNAMCLPEHVGEKRKSCSNVKNSASKSNLSVFYKGPKGGIYYYAKGFKLYAPVDTVQFIQKHFIIHNE